MGKHSRKARRQARRAKRKERRQDLNDFISALNNANTVATPDDDSNPPTVLGKFNEIWPILKPALKFTISLKLTKEKVDQVLEEVIKAGDVVASGGSDESVGVFIKKFKPAWSKIETALELVQIVTPNNVDNVLDDIIEIGDWIAGE